jgi:hypothetical protein
MNYTCITVCYNSFVTVHADNCETPVSCLTYLSNIQGECSVKCKARIWNSFENLMTHKISWLTESHDSQNLLLNFSSRNIYMNTRHTDKSRDKMKWHDCMYSSCTGLLVLQQQVADLNICLNQPIAHCMVHVDLLGCSKNLLIVM